MQLVSICGPRLHQIKQIVIPAYQVVRLNFDCEVEVRLVIDVSGEGKSFRNSSDKLSGFAQPFDECRNCLVGQFRKPRSNVWARENIFYLIENIAADE